jgi:ABC-type multidrug transport system fused ATPase/permease subunit
LTRLSGDISAIEDLLVSGLSDLVAYTTTILLFIGVLWYLDATLLLVSFAILPFLALSTVIGARRARHAQQDIRARASHLTSTAEEALSMIALVKAFARGRHERGRFADATEEAAVARLGSVRVQAVFPPLADLLTAIGTALVVYLGATQVINHHLSLGSLVVFLSYLGALYTPIQGLTSLNTTVQRALVGAERVSEILDAPAEMFDRDWSPHAGRARVSGVSTRHLWLRSGTAGAARHQPAHPARGDGRPDRPHRGGKNVGGQPAAQLLRPRCWRRPARRPTGECVQCRQRQATDQRQRLALARALVKDAPVLVLDEATSALDPKTESAVVNALRPIMADRAVLIVAHRFSTVRHADRIVVLRDGRIVEEGPPAGLLDNPDGPYRQFVNEQTEPLRAIRRARRARNGATLAARRRRDGQDPVEEATRS